jgi:hypothetical protein
MNMTIQNQAVAYHFRGSYSGKISNKEDLKFL